MTKRILITGAAGCIGAWICKGALDRGWTPVAVDIDDRYHRWPGIMTPEEIEAVVTLQVDITDAGELSQAVEKSGAEQFIHAAALQIPFNRADPTRGALVNVVGTVNVFEAARVHELGPTIYASSVAVYGSPSEYSTDILPADAAFNPSELYGVNKICNEETARIYWEQYQVASLGIRPHTVYGPGRDAGMTSDPTKAILAAVKGESYRIGYGGRSGFQYVEDVAGVMLAASERTSGGAGVYGLRGQVAEMAEFVAAIHAVLPGSADLISHEPQPLDLPAGMDDSALRSVLGEIPDRTITDGVAATADVFSQQAARP